MANNDWFTQSVGNGAAANPAYGSGPTSIATPQRRPLRSSGFVSSQGGFDDDLEPEDARLAAGITYLPNFGSTPQGRAAMAQSPAGVHASLSGSIGNPSSSPSVAQAQPRRSSPTHRFQPGGVFGATDRTSPRASPRGRQALPNISGSAVDEDAPPTTTLDDSMDSVSSSRTPETMLGHSPRMIPPSQLSTSPIPTTTSLHVYGPPAHMLPNLRTYLEQCGTIVSLVPGPEESNWITVTYAAEWEAAMLLRRNGDVVGGKYLLGVKLAGPGSLAGCSLNTQTGQRNAAQSSQATEPASFASGVGTPMRMMSGDVPSIFKPRTGTASGSGGMINAADYDWDERPGRSTQAQGAQSGFLGRVGELVFGR